MRKLNYKTIIDNKTMKSRDKHMTFDHALSLRFWISCIFFVSKNVPMIQTGSCDSEYPLLNNKYHWFSSLCVSFPLESLDNRKIKFTNEQFTVRNDQYRCPYIFK